MNARSCFTMPTLEPRLRTPFAPRLLSTSAPGSTRRGRVGSDGEPNADTVSTKTDNPSAHRTSSQALAAP